MKTQTASKNGTQNVQIKSIEAIIDYTHNAGQMHNGIGYLDGVLVAFKSVGADEDAVTVKQITLAESLEWSNAMIKEEMEERLPDSSSDYAGRFRWHQELAAAIVPDDVKRERQEKHDKDQANKAEIEKLAQVCCYYSGIAGIYSGIGYREDGKLVEFSAARYIGFDAEEISFEDAVEWMAHLAFAHTRLLALDLEEDGGGKARFFQDLRAAVKVAA